MKNILASVCVGIWVLFIATLLSLSSCAPVASQTILATAPASDVIWRGDAETGDTSQWCSVNEAVPGRISVVTAPVAQGNYAYKVILNNGDRVFSTERVTLSKALGKCSSSNSTFETGERFYGWSVFIPAEYSNHTAWAQVAQWKGVHSGSPPIQLGLQNGKWELEYRPTTSSGNLTRWSVPIKQGQWETFVLHVNWAADNTGFIEFWYNGVLVVPKFNTPTMHISQDGVVPVFVQIGLYRDSSISTNAIIYHDGMTAGKTYESVTGVLPPPVTVIPSDTFTPTLVPTKTSTPNPFVTVCSPVSLEGRNYNLCTAP